jgi:protein-disulfide isomerase
MSRLRIPVSADDHIQGDLLAVAVLVEYGDYQCPYCGEVHPVVKQLQRMFGADLCLVFRNFPLNEAHPEAETAAETAEFAGAYGRFWEAHDALFENQNALSPMLYPELAKTLGLSAQELLQSLEQETFRGRVRADFLGGVRSGVNGTPTFFINGWRYDGAPYLEELAQAIESSR